MQEISDLASTLVVRRTKESAVMGGPPTRVVLLAPARTRTETINAASISNSSASFNATTPGPTTTVGRTWNVTLTVSVQPKDNAGVAVTFTAGCDAPSADPGNAMVNHAKLTLNGSSTDSARQSDTLPIIHSQLSPEQKSGSFSVSPMQSDGCNEFSQLFGTNRSPMSAEGSTTVESRAEFPYKVNGLTREYDWTFPLRVSPLTQEKNGEGIVGLSNWDVNLQFADLFRCWSHDSVNAPLWSGLDVNILAAKITLSYSSPESDSVMPMYQVLPYDSYQVFPTVIAGAIAAAGTGTVTSTALSLSTMPSVIHLTIPRTGGSRSETQTSSCCKITKVSMTLANASGQLNTKPVTELFEMSRQAGSQLSYIDWSSKAGSIVSINVAAAVGGDGRSPGEKGGPYQIQFEVEYQNITQAAFTGELLLTIVTPGQVTIGQQAANFDIGLFSPAERDLAIHDSESIEGIEDEGAGEVGGSFMSSMRHFAKKASHSIAKVVSTVDRIAAPIAAAVGGPEGIEIAKALDMAKSVTAGVSKVAGGGMIGGGMVGGGIVGGRAGLQQQPRSRLMRLSGR